MARQLRPFSRPLFSFSDAFAARAANGNRFAEDRAIIEVWDLLGPLWLAVDALKPMGPTGQRERPMRIPRSLLLKMAVAIRALGLGPQVGMRRIQTSFVLRAALGIGGPDINTVQRLRGAVGGVDVSEEGFPTRQVMKDLVQRWLPRYGGFELLDDYAHLVLPYEIGVELGADFSVAAIDSKMAPSPRRFTEKTDVMGIGRDQGPILPGTAGRLAHGVIACKDVPVLLAGDLINMSEHRWAKAVAIASVAERAKVMETWLKRDGVRGDRFLTAHETTWVGDGLYAANEIALACIDASARFAFRIPAFPWREVLCEYTAWPEGMPHIRTTLEIASGGVCYCPCDRAIAGASGPLTERVPMAQFVGKPGTAGFNFYACERASCPRRSVRFKVPFSAVRLSTGDPNFAVVTQMPRADKRTEAINFKGQQTIEQRNNALVDLGLAKRMPDKGFVLTGAASSRFELLLAHIVLNSRILLNARAGRFERTEYPWAQGFEGAIRKSRQIVERVKTTDREGVIKEYPKIGSLFYPLPEEMQSERINETSAGHRIELRRTPESQPDTVAA